MAHQEFASEPLTRTPRLFIYNIYISYIFSTARDLHGTAEPAIRRAVLNALPAELGTLLANLPRAARVAGALALGARESRARLSQPLADDDETLRALGWSSSRRASRDSGGSADDDDGGAGAGDGGGPSAESFAAWQRALFPERRRELLATTADVTSVTHRGSEDRSLHGTSSLTQARAARDDGGRRRLRRRRAPLRRRA